MICDKQFRLVDIEEHMQDDHEKKDLQNAKMTESIEVKECLYCGKPFGNINDIMKHVNENHKEMADKVEKMAHAA